MVGGVLVNLVEKVMRAGEPLNAEQLRVLLAGCNIFVTQAEARWLLSRYAHVMRQPQWEQAVSRS